MNCCLCSSPVNAARRENATLTFGAVRKGSRDFDQQAEQAAQRVLAHYLPTLSLSAHLDDWNPAVEITGDHPDLPQPALVAFQSEFTFCSTRCLRRWLMEAVDLLDELCEQSADPPVDVHRENPVFRSLE